MAKIFFDGCSSVTTIFWIIGIGCGSVIRAESQEASNVVCLRCGEELNQQKKEMNLQRKELDLQNREINYLKSIEMKHQSEIDSLHEQLKKFKQVLQEPSKELEWATFDGEGLRVHSHEFWFTKVRKVRAWLCFILFAL